jgi:hypothetical protein
MGRGKPRPKRVHIAFPGRVGFVGSGLICGVSRAGAIIAADPRKVTCQTCAAYVARHPEHFGLPARRCRSCHCTDADCSGCVKRTGAPCYWVEDDLCSACVPRAA